jgi:HlyD family secretion protein
MTKTKLFVILLFIVGAAISVFKSLESEGGSDEIILNGNVEMHSTNVSFKNSGRISEILIDEGRRVKKGEILAKIDDDVLKAQYELAKAKVAESEINLEMCEKDFIRNKDLFKTKSVSEKLFDDSRMRYIVAKAQKDAAVANLKIAEMQLDDTVLKSPLDGVVLTNNVEIGEFVSPGIPVFSITSEADTKIKSFVSENVLSKIKIGGRVYVMIDSLPDKKFEGRVSFISPESEFTPKNVETKELRTSLMYRIRIVLDGHVDELKHGMPVTMLYQK